MLFADDTVCFPTAALQSASSQYNHPCTQDACWIHTYGICHWPEDVVDLADVLLVLQVDIGIEVRNLGVAELAYDIPLAVRDDDANLCLPHISRNKKIKTTTAQHTEG